MLHLVKGFRIAAQYVTAIKDIDDNTCSVFFVGQSALEGHVVNCSGEEAETEIDAYLAEDSEPVSMEDLVQALDELTKAKKQNG
jgi:hypothetical protein